MVARLATLLTMAFAALACSHQARRAEPVTPIARGAGAKIRVPAASAISLELEGYALDHAKAPPGEGERFAWVKGEPGLPYHRELLSLASKGEIDQETTQTLLWNLGRETAWEDYAPELRAILTRVDPNAPVRLPSALKSDLRGRAIAYLKGKIDGADRLDDVEDLVADHFDRHPRYARQPKGSASESSRPRRAGAAAIPDSPLSAVVQINDYRRPRVTFYNPTNAATDLDLSLYVLRPSRPNVQRLSLVARGVPVGVRVRPSNDKQSHPATSSRARSTDTFSGSRTPSNCRDFLKRRSESRQDAHHQIEAV